VKRRLLLALVVILCIANPKLLPGSPREDSTQSAQIPVPSGTGQSTTLEVAEEKAGSRLCDLCEDSVTSVLRSFPSVAALRRCVLLAPSTAEGGLSTPRSRPQSDGSHSYQVSSSPHRRIHRSAAAKRAFMRQTGHPHGWEGHVVDHIVPLACGGADDPSNMQWQTVEEAKAKDKWERKDCE